MERDEKAVVAREDQRRQEMHDDRLARWQTNCREFQCGIVTYGRSTNEEKKVEPYSSLVHALCSSSAISLVRAHIADDSCNPRVREKVREKGKYNVNLEKGTCGGMAGMENNVAHV